MAKESGLGWTTCSVDNASSVLKDIKNDVTNLEFSTPYNVQEITGIDKSAMERLLLLADYQGTLNTVFNPAADRVHAVLVAGDLRVARTLTNVISTKSLSAEVLFTDAAYTRAASGEFTGSHPFALADGTTPTWT
jgi:hypothetical protein